MAGFANMVGCDWCRGWFYYCDVGLKKGVKLPRKYCCPRCVELEALKKREEELTKKMSTYQRLEKDLVSSSKAVRQEGWQVPKKTAKSTIREAAVEVPVKNRYAELQREERKEVIVVGSSNVNRFSGFVFKNGGAKVERKDVGFGCFPGASTHHLIGKMKRMVPKKRKAKVYIHVGTNDVVSKNSAEIVSNTKKLIAECKSANQDVEVAVCSIPPRFDRGEYVHRKSTSVNDLLSAACREMDAEFLDLRPAFRECRGEVMGRDGVHYSRAGAEVVGKSLAVNIVSFLA